MILAGILIGILGGVLIAAAGPAGWALGGVLCLFGAFFLILGITGKGKEEKK